MLTRMDVQGGAGKPLGLCRGAQGFPFEVGQRPGAADLADEAGADTRGADSLLDVPNNLSGDLPLRFRLQIGRNRSVEVIPRTHDDMKAGFPGNAGQGFWRAAQPDIAHFDDGISPLPV